MSIAISPLSAVQPGSSEQVGALEERIARPRVHPLHHPSALRHAPRVRAHARIRMPSAVRSHPRSRGPIAMPSPFPAPAPANNPNSLGTMVEKEGVHVAGTIVARTVSTGIIQAMKGMWGPQKQAPQPAPAPASAAPSAATGTPGQGG